MDNNGSANGRGSPIDIDREFLSALGGDLLRGVWSQARPVQLQAGETLFRQGEPGDSMYVVMRGRLSVSIALPGGGQQVIDELARGASVGEMALLTGRARSATVTAIEDTSLLQLSRQGFDYLGAKDPAVLLDFARAVLPRLRRSQLAGILASLFGQLSVEALRELEESLEWLSLRSGQVLFEKGDPGDAFYIVIDGRLRVVAPAQHGEQPLHELGRGESVGEADLLTGEPRLATAYATRDTSVVRFSQKAFERLASKYPRAVFQITTNVFRRMRKAQGAAHGPVLSANIALVPATAGIALTEFARQLRVGYLAGGPCLHLNSEQFDRLMGKPGIAQTPEEHPTAVSILGWLSEQEEKYPYIIYEADPGWTEWTRRCVRQADRVLIVADARKDPARGSLERAMELMQVKARQELVLLHSPTTTRPAHTGRWLAARPVAAHHHVRMGNADDFAHVARMTTGRAMGLVLGGGGARGYAHIGVMRALDEAGLPVDIVGGTSMGALMAGYLAASGTWQSAVEVARHFGNPRKLFDYTLPLVSFFSSRKLNRMLVSVFGNTHIEDLWRPFFCVSSNLTQAQPVVHTRGLLWIAVRASLAIPGIFSPVLYEGDVLVDGGKMNNLPVDVMAGLVEGGPVIAVSVSPEREMAADYRFGLSISGWEALWGLVNPFGKRIKAPNLFSNIMRSSDLHDVLHHEERTQLADLLIAPSVEQFSILNFRPLDSIAEAGYAAAKPAIEGWLNSEETRARWGALPSRH